MWEVVAAERMVGWRTGVKASDVVKAEAKVVRSRVQQKMLAVSKVIVGKGARS